MRVKRLRTRACQASVMVIGVRKAVFAGPTKTCLWSIIVTPVSSLTFLLKGLVSLFRTIPDFVWALIFVVSVGLGAVAGTMTILVDTIGFCGRFFAPAKEDADKEPQQALEATGGSHFFNSGGGRHSRCLAVLDQHDALCA